MGLAPLQSSREVLAIPLTPPRKGESSGDSSAPYLIFPPPAWLEVVDMKRYGPYESRQGYLFCIDIDGPARSVGW